MEPALPGQALSPGVRVKGPGGRRRAALPPFWGLSGAPAARRALAAALALAALAALAAGCRPAGSARLGRRWRVGLGACGMSVDAGGTRLAVVCRRSNDVWVLALPDGRFVERIDTLPRPRAVLFHPEEPAFYVAEGLSSVAEVRLSDQRVARSFRPPWRIGGFSWEPASRRLFCSHSGLPTLGVYRLKDMHLETTEAVGGEVEGVAFSGRDAWVATRAADALVRISLKDMGIKAAALAGPEPRGLALDPGAGLAYVPCHGRAGQAQALALPSPVPTPAGLSPLSPGAMAEDEDEPLSPSAAIADGDDEDEDQDQDAGVAGPPAPADAAASHRWDGSGVAVVRLEDVRRVDYIAVDGGPVAAVLSPSGRRLAVACEDGRLRLVDLAQRAVVDTLDLGGRPGALILAPGGGTLLAALGSDKAVVEVLPGSGWR